MATPESEAIRKAEIEAERTAVLVDIRDRLVSVEAKLDAALEAGQPTTRSAKSAK